MYKSGRNKAKVRTLCSEVAKFLFLCGCNFGWHNLLANLPIPMLVRRGRCMSVQWPNPTWSGLEIPYGTFVTPQTSIGLLPGLKSAELGVRIAAFKSYCVNYAFMSSKCIFNTVQRTVSDR